jgi:hypothetical protein
VALLTSISPHRASDASRQHVLSPPQFRFTPVTNNVYDVLEACDRLQRGRQSRKRVMRAEDARSNAMACGHAPDVCQQTWHVPSTRPEDKEATEEPEPLF